MEKRDQFTPFRAFPVLCGTVGWKARNITPARSPLRFFSKRQLFSYSAIAFAMYQKRGLSTQGLLVKPHSACTTSTHLPKAKILHARWRLLRTEDREETPGQAKE